MRFASLALLASAMALSNTSPLIVLGEKTPFVVAESHDVSRIMSMRDAFEGVVGPATDSCKYDTYLFVKHPHVSERDINDRTAPFISRAIDAAASQYLLSTAIEGYDVESFVPALESHIAAHCHAQRVIADAQTLFEPYGDTQPRVISLELPEDTSVEEADAILRKTIGMLPTPNFFLAYRTTPALHQRAAEEPGEPGQSEKPYESLFANYQFFSPALFMGLIVSTLLLVVFVIALRAVGSLQITPVAFDPKLEPPKKKQN